MAELITFGLEGGGTVRVESGDDASGVVRVGRRSGEVMSDGVASFESALDGVRDAASAALRRFRAMEASPEEIQLEFGVRLSAEAGAVIAKTAVEGHLRVSLVWKKADGSETTVSDDEPDPESEPEPEPGSGSGPGS